MAFVVPYVGERNLLRRIVGLDTNGNMSLRLWVNSALTPNDSTVLADITECTTAGYAPIALTTSSWSVATVGTVTTASYPEQTFTMTSGPIDIYGYFIVDNTATKLLLIERFPTAPYSLPAGGGQIAITPTMNLQ